MGIYKTALMYKKADQPGKGLNARPAGSPLSREEHEALVQQGRRDAEANTGWFKNVSLTKPSTWVTPFLGSQMDYDWHQKQNAMKVDPNDPVAKAKRDAYLAGVNGTTSQYTANTRANASGGIAVATNTLNGLYDGAGDAYADALGAGSIQDNLDIVRETYGDDAADYWDWTATGAQLGMSILRDAAMGQGVGRGVTVLGNIGDKARRAHQIAKATGRVVLAKPPTVPVYGRAANIANKVIDYGEHADTVFNAGATAYEHKDDIADALRN